MLILKGNSMKSEIVNSLMRDGHSVCYAYDDTPVIYGEHAFFVDKRECPLWVFFDRLYSKFIDTYKDDYYKYLIIYTNEKEDTLKEYIDWIKENRIAFRCCQILITCKE